MRRSSRHCATAWRRLGPRLADDPDARAALDAATRALVNKLLHEPTIRLKEAAGTARGELYADALAELFALALHHAED